MRLVKPSKVFSKPAKRATPFCTITLPECKWVTVGKPRSLRNSKASKICRPNLCTCGRGRPFPRVTYFWLQSSFQLFLSIWRNGMRKNCLKTNANVLDRICFRIILPRIWGPSSSPDLSAAQEPRNSVHRIPWSRDQARVKCTGAEERGINDSAFLSSTDKRLLGSFCSVEPGSKVSRLLR